jgi:cytochrome c-type biogenesis protein CcmE
MKTKSVVGFGVMVLFMSLLLMNFGSQVGGYATFDAVAQGQKAHIIGTWAKEHPTTYDEQANVFTFHMRDEEGSLRRVVYHNTKPSNFEDATELVVEGHRQGDSFVASHILVKCPSKYNETQPIKDTVSFPVPVIPADTALYSFSVCIDADCVRMGSSGTHTIIVSGFP